MISVAVQSGNYVCVYDEKNRQIARKIGILCGYTSQAYSIKKDYYVYTYDIKYHQVTARYSK